MPNQPQPRFASLQRKRGLAVFIGGPERWFSVGRPHFERNTRHRLVVLGDHGHGEDIRPGSVPGLDTKTNVGCRQFQKRTDGRLASLPQLQPLPLAPRPTPRPGPRAPEQSARPATRELASSRSRGPSSFALARPLHVRDRVRVPTPTAQSVNPPEVLPRSSGAIAMAAAAAILPEANGENTAPSLRFALTSHSPRDVTRSG